jgi:hypothetical protein
LTCTAPCTLVRRRAESTARAQRASEGYWIWGGIVQCRYLPTVLPVLVALLVLLAAGCWLLAAGGWRRCGLFCLVCILRVRRSSRRCIPQSQSQSHPVVPALAPVALVALVALVAPVPLLAPPSTRQQRFRASCQNASSSAAAGTFPLLAAGGPPIAAPVSPPNPANHTASTALLSARNAPASSGLARFLSCRRHQHGTAAPQHRSTAPPRCTIVPLLNTTVAALCRIVGPFKLGFVLAGCSR